MTPKYPDVTVNLSECDGNAFVVIGKCRSAARRSNVPADEIKAFMDEAMAGNYDHLLQTCMRWFDVV